MPFKDLPEGQTHYQNDGCGMEEHNDKKEWWEEYIESPHGIYDHVHYSNVPNLISEANRRRDEEWRENMSDIPACICATILAKIEDIVSDDFCHDMEMDLLYETCGTKNEKIAYEKLSLIYKIVHANNKAHTCYYVHDNWRKL